MLGGTSAFSLVAAMLYVIVASAAMLAVSRAMIQRQVKWHRWVWMAVFATFMVLALLRVLNVEDWLRNDLRTAFYDKNMYENRRIVQAPLTAVLLLVSAALPAGLLYGVAKGVNGRRNVAALGALVATGGMIFLYVLRLVSLHSVDALLYGPFKLNWLIDIGLSLAALACALRYRSVVQRRLG